MSSYNKLNILVLQSFVSSVGFPCTFYFHLLLTFAMHCKKMVRDFNSTTKITIYYIHIMAYQVKLDVCVNEGCKSSFQEITTWKEAFVDGRSKKKRSSPPR